MKTKIQNSFHQFTAAIALIAAALFFTTASARAVNYAGNGQTGFGGNIGNGTLSVTDDGTNITFNLQPDNGIGGNDLALYIDTGAPGFSSTTNFNDASDGGRISLSGYDPTANSGNLGQSVLTFTNGFSPSYGISFSSGYTSLFELANGGNDSFTYITGTGTATLTFTIAASQIGLTPGVPGNIRLFGSYISGSGYRSTEALPGNDYGSFGNGWVPFTQTAYATYSFDAPPATAQPVTFQVDMTAQIAAGNFNPGNGDLVYAEGTFQTNPWTGFQLTPSAGNTNIYTGTYLDFNPTNAAEQFKFEYYSASANTNIQETLDNRPFTLQSGGQTLALVYFDDVFPTPSATTNNLTFSIDMTAQIELGHFNPATDQIEALGTFENPKWTAGFILTNNPGISASNVYSGTIADGNYPGSFEEYKFVIVSGANSTYESGNNRMFFTPTNAYTFPVAYFNNISSITPIPVTFQVDMTVPLITGAFVPANGDTVSADGTFQQPKNWVAGTFVLTNNPAGANSNIYVGTYVDLNGPGSAEQYLFQINPGGNGGTPNYESVNNRTFVVAASAQTLPVALWNNQNTNNILLQATTITFTVNMTNAVDIYGNPFDPANDDVIIAGTFTNPQWTVNWTDPLITIDDSQYILQNNPVGSLLYTYTATLPAGSPFQVIYKYGIIHNAGVFGGNTNADNEAAVDLNHTRYVRTSGTYNFPVDIFGLQNTNLAAATEPAFGNLIIAGPSAGTLPISWLGLPSVHLQTTTNLLNGTWQDLGGTTGAGSTNWPTSSGNRFFRLVQP